MSTIEKAAARLSARQARNGQTKPAPGTAAPQGTIPPAERRADLSERARSVANGGLRFCDVDLTSMAERGFLTPGITGSRLSHEMRRIKRPLLLNSHRARTAAARGEVSAPPANLIMVTSALPGEGKTFVSINLAISMAGELDRRVLLVDADIARGDVSSQLGIQSERGLAELLQETGYLTEESVLSTNIDRLSILPAGSPVGNVDELFASEQMVLIAHSLAEVDPNRIVIFDTSPLLATTEAAVLARHMGQIVVVVEANRTPQDAVARALEHLEGCSNINLVLNKTSGGDAGGYGYGYGYGAYGAGGREAKTETG